MPAKSQIRGYSTYGEVRGQCGHLHATQAEARRCLAEDRSAVGVAYRGAYSDRRVVAVGPDGYLYRPGGAWVPSSGGRTCGAMRFESE